MMAHAAAWGDIDGDGDLDLYVGGFGDRPNVDYAPAPGPVPNVLFRISEWQLRADLNPSVELHGRTSNAALVDLNNDGRLDLYVANNTRSRSNLPSGLRRDAQLQRSMLFRNDGGAFAGVADADNICLTGAGSARSVGVLDYDADGALDLLVLDDGFDGKPHTRLCRNLGGFRFQDVTADAGLPRDLFGLGLAIADLNNDRRPDIFVSYSNRLFVSATKGYVEPPGPKATLGWQPLDAEDWPGGAVFADLNRDGRQDLVVGIHHDRARNRVYLHDGVEQGVPVFRDVLQPSASPPG